MRRVFYIIYIKEDTLGDCLDAVRFLAEPTEKCRSHITVRGPYSRKIGIRTLSQKVAGVPIKVGRAGHFFNSRQNTVFLDCEAPGLRKVWQKPDYLSFNPHITLYDGPSSGFARELYKVVSQYTYELDCHADGLAEFVSMSGQGSFALSFTFNDRLISEIVGEYISPAIASKMPAKRRLAIIERICKHLSSLSVKQTEPSPV